MDLKRKYLGIFLLFVLFTAYARAEAEPEADPQAQADAQAEPEPQYAMAYGRPPYNVMPDPGFTRPDPNDCSSGFCGGNGGRPPYYPPAPGPSPGPSPGPAPGPDMNNACGMTDMCCQMDQQNCCLNKKQCYWVYKQECDGGNNVQCPIVNEQSCHDIKTPECRDEVKFEKRSFVGKVCKKRPKTVCWDADIEVCEGTPEVKEETIGYTNQELKLIGIEKKEHCKDISGNTCDSYNETVSNTVTKYRTEYRNFTQNKCEVRYVSGGVETIKVPRTVVEYTKECFTTNRKVCSAVPCVTTGVCESGYSPCSTNQFNTVNVCGESENQRPGVGGCQQVQEPVCGQAPNCGVNYQQCCRDVPQTVCRQVPKYVTKYIEQTVQRPGRWVRDCKPFVISQPYQVPYTENVERVVTKYRCKPITEPKCYEVEIPKYDVEETQEVGKITINVPQCTKRPQKKKVCATIPDGTVECEEMTIPKTIKIVYSVCDREKIARQCFNIPVPRCMEYPSNNCRMVPKQVCQDTCQESSYCNTCTQFVNSGSGFGSCPTSTCPNYIGNNGNNITSPYPYGQPMMPQQGMQFGGMGGMGGYGIALVDDDEDLFN